MKSAFSFFVLILCAAAHASPPPPFENFSVQTTNTPSAKIAGFILPAAPPVRGTLFLCHGYMMSKESYYGFDWIRRDLHWNLVAFDFREHGESTHDNRMCTLGYYEIYDLKAAIDYAQSQHLPGPYAIYGRSLGAAVGLRWASEDHRITGVFAQSPFKDALSASEEFPAAKLGIRLPSVYRLAPGLADMLRSVDIPQAVSHRNDLRICLIAGEHDCFPLDEQRSILTASASPASMKSMYVFPGFGHRGLWAWQGDAQVPSHEQLVRSFLDQCEPPPVVVPVTRVHKVMHMITGSLHRPISKRVWISGVACGAFVGLLLFVRRRRNGLVA